MESPHAVLITWNWGDNDSLTLNSVYINLLLNRLFLRQEALSSTVSLAVHPHSRHGMHPQNKGISVGGGLLCLTSDLSVKGEVTQQFTTACQRRKCSILVCGGPPCQSTGWKSSSLYLEFTAAFKILGVNVIYGIIFYSALIHLSVVLR